MSGRPRHGKLPLTRSPPLSVDNAQDGIDVQGYSLLQSLLSWEVKA